MSLRMNEDVYIGDYVVYRKLGKGGFGQVYLVKGDKDKKFYALKLAIENRPRSRESIDNEIRAYLDLKGFSGIPTLLDYGFSDGLRYLGIPLFDTTLQVLLETQAEVFTVRSTILIGKKLLKILEFIHSKGRIYRDLKPENIAVGHDNKIYLIDFGMSKRYIDENGNHIPEIRNKSLSGTAWYASINTHRGIEQSRRDDMEGLFYVLIVLFKSTLPWMGIKGASQKERETEIAKMKKNTTVKELCSGIKGMEYLVEFIKYVRRLQFQEAPNYSYIDGLFNKVLNETGVEHLPSPRFLEQCESNNTAASVSLWTKLIYMIKAAAFK